MIKVQREAYGAYFRGVIEEGIKQGVFHVQDVGVAKMFVFSALNQTYRSSAKGVYACGDARIGQSLIVTAIAEGRKCARVVNKDLGGSPMDADREMLALGAWSGEADRTLRHEAEAAGTVRPGEEFFTGPGART